MLSSQQIESGSVSTTASWPSSFRACCRSAIFFSACNAGERERLHGDGARLASFGRVAPHTASTGFRASGFSLKPFGCAGLGQRRQRHRACAATDHSRSRRRRQLACAIHAIASVATLSTISNVSVSICCAACSV